MKQTLALRITLNILLLISILFLPWWTSAFLALLLVMTFDAYEVVFWGVIADALYSAAIADLFETTFVFTLGFTALLIAAMLVKPLFVFYDVE